MDGRGCTVESNTNIGTCKDFFAKNKMVIRAQANQWHLKAKELKKWRKKHKELMKEKEKKNCELCGKSYKNFTTLHTQSQYNTHYHHGHWLLVNNLLYIFRMCDILFLICTFLCCRELRELQANIQVSLGRAAVVVRCGHKLVVCGAVFPPSVVT